jgi:hypothetical protein
MLNILNRQSKVVEATDDIVNDIRNTINTKYNLDLDNDMVANIISSQTYLAFSLGIKNNIDVRFPRLGAFKVNQKLKKIKDIEALVLTECNGDKQLAKDTMNHLKEKNVLQTFQIR